MEEERFVQDEVQEPAAAEPIEEASAIAADEISETNSNQD